MRVGHGNRCVLGGVAGILAPNAALQSRACRFSKYFNIEYYNDEARRGLMPCLSAYAHGNELITES
jgi:hypothetical protein